MRLFQSIGAPEAPRLQFLIRPVQKAGDLYASQHSDIAFKTQMLRQHARTNARAQWEL